jgi:hypothetical protein
MTVEIDEADRQMILLALAKLTIERPGFLYSCSELAARFSGRDVFESFRRLHCGEGPKR